MAANFSLITANGAILILEIWVLAYLEALN